jgi:spore germination cell wall hydrolase CwlJ-like protein
MTPRWALVGIAALAVTNLAACGGRDSEPAAYPDHEITFVVPYSAGGPTDTVTRLIAEPMSTKLGQQIVVENVGGAGGMVGSARVARSEPNGYAILRGSTDTLAQMEAAQKLTPTVLPEGDTGRSARPGRTGQSPRAHVAGLRAGGTRRSADGSTPQAARAFAMSSTTPAPFDERLQVVYAPAILETMEKGKEGQTIARQGAPDRPNYAALVNQPKGEREERCLAEAIYFEARSEPVAGQAAVAQVVLNRAKSGLYPPSICGVVYQNRHRYLGCQFTFACEGKALRVTEPEPWKTAARIAREVLDGTTFLTEVGGSTHYHANYVNPRWAKRLMPRSVQ